MGLNVLQEEAMIALYGSSALTSSSPLSPATAPSPQVTEQNKMLEHWIDLVNEISFNAQASVDVLDDFLNYDKIATGELSLEYTIVPIWSLINDTVSEFKLPMSKKNLTLHFNLPNATEKQNTINELLINNNDNTNNNTPSSSSSSSSSSWDNPHEVLEGSDDTFTVSNSKQQIVDLETNATSNNNTNVHSYVQDQKLIGDSVRITQVIRNLVSNAIKFSKEEGDIYITTKFEALIGNSNSKSSSSSSSNKRKNERRKPNTKSSTSSSSSSIEGGTKNTFKLKSQEVVTCEKTGNLSFMIKDTGVGLSKPQLKKLFGSGVQFDVNELQAGKGMYDIICSLHIICVELFCIVSFRIVLSHLVSHYITSFLPFPTLSLSLSIFSSPRRLQIT
jgi:signal transduction histidine kinase